MSPGHLKAITRKEIAHILRDRTTLILVLFTPTLLLLLMAYALTVDLEHVPIAVLDHDQSAASRLFIQQITAGDDLDLYGQADSYEEVNDLFMGEEIKAALIIAPTFSEQLAALVGMPVQIIIDGTEPSGGAYAVDHIVSRAEEFVALALSDQMKAMGTGERSLQPIDLRVRAWYNPGLKPRVDMIPGLISLVLGFPALSVALTLAQEHEHGTMEQLIVSPIGRTDLLLGKMIPYVFVGILNVILMPVLAMWWFGIPFNGSFLTFFLLSVVFMFSILSMGVLIGVFMKTQATALAVSFLLIFFPGFFLTGIFFPIVAMPDIMRLEAMGLPGTHYAYITRGVFLPGVGLEVLWPYAVMLFVLGAVFTGVAAIFFKKKLG
jgi:ABC-2 type transport system permease protein